MRMARLISKVIGVVVVLFLIFLSIGLMFPSFSYTSKVEVHSTVEHSWEIFTDERYMKEWFPGFQRMEKISGEPLTVGSKWKLITKEDGKI